jgi:hypothetical protein
MQSYVYLADVVLQRIKVRITKLNFFPHFLKPCLVIIDWLLLIDMSPTHILHRPDGAAVQGIGVVLEVWTQVMLKTLGTTCMLLAYLLV